MRTRWLAVLATTCLLAACSIELNGGTAQPTNSVPIFTASGDNLAPGVGQATAPASQVAWLSLGLRGRLVYTLGKAGINALDLATGESKSLFVPPKDAWLTSASMAPDGSRLAMAYAPPPSAGTPQLGYTGVYQLPGDCDTRPLGCAVDDIMALVPQSDPHEAYFSPVFGADANTLYLAHFRPSDSDTNTPFAYSVQRLDLPNNTPRLVAENSIWPAVSPSGSRIAYVWFNPVDYSNNLYVAKPDNSGARVLVDPTQFDAVDAPFFTAGGSSIIFSAVGDGTGRATPTPGALGWIDQLLGVRIASAAPNFHNVPSDWWEVPVLGGIPRRLTQLADTGLFGASAPDGQHIAFQSASGLYVMKRDGSELTTLMKFDGSLGASGTVVWVK